MLGAYLLSSGVYDKYYYAAQKARTLITQDYDAAYAKVDTILIARLSRAQPLSLARSATPRRCTSPDLYTISPNICGNGGISVPPVLGEDTQLPVSAQLVGPAFKDRQLLHVCPRLERGFLPIPPRMRPRFPSRPILPGREASCNEGAFRGPCRIGRPRRPGDPYRAHRTRYQDVLQLQAQPR